MTDRADLSTPKQHPWWEWAGLAAVLAAMIAVSVAEAVGDLVPTALRGGRTPGQAS